MKASTLSRWSRIRSRRLCALLCLRRPRRFGPGGGWEAGAVDTAARTGFHLGLMLGDFKPQET